MQTVLWLRTRRLPRMAWDYPNQLERRAQHDDIANVLQTVNIKQRAYELVLTLGCGKSEFGVVFFDYERVLLAVE